MGRIASFAFLAAAGYFLVSQLWHLWGQGAALQGQLAEIREKTTPIAKENGELAVSLENFANSQDVILRELRRAGYAAPGEKVFVIVPKR
jgi:cell division protein FtsB